MQDFLLPIKTKRTSWRTYKVLRPFQSQATNICAFFTLAWMFKRYTSFEPKPSENSKAWWRGGGNSWLERGASGGSIVTSFEMTFKMQTSL